MHFTGRELTEWVEILNKFGIGVAAIVAITGLLWRLINWLISKHDAKTDKQSEIQIQLIDRIRIMDEHLIEIGGKVNVKRKHKQ